MDAENFLNDQKTIDAVTRNLEIVGEAARQMDDEARAVDKEYVMGLEKGLLLIEAFGVSNSPLTLTEAADITGHSKASTRRALLTLVKLGSARASGRHFFLEPRTLRLVHAYVNSTPLTKVAQPILEITSERTRESASLAVLDSPFVVFVARSTQRRSLSLPTGIVTVLHRVRFQC